jgi:hypothetical protein
MSSATDGALPKPAAKARKVKPLPDFLSSLTDKDREKFVITLEADPNQKSGTYGTEFPAVQAISVQVDGEEEEFSAHTLTVDQFRIMCKNVGVSNCGSKNKFQCRTAIARHFRFLDDLDKRGLKPTSHASRVTSTVCRAVNVVFSDQFFEDFKNVNDRKDRRDHETSNTNKQFWIRATLAHNGGGDDDDLLDSDDDEEKDGSESECDDFTQLVYPVSDTHLLNLDCDEEVNLFVFDQFETLTFRKKITTLFKIRRIIKDNMTESGTHDSEPWNFVGAAMKNYSGITKISVYYFYMRCEAHPDMDAHFQPFMDASLKGSTEDLGDVDPGPPSSSKKQKTEESLAALVEQSGMIMQHLKDANELRESNNKANQKKVKFQARLDVAKALGDTEVLRSLMKEAEEFD